MATLRALYRDPDRTPYLATLHHDARARGLDVELVRAPLHGGAWAERLESGDVDVITENYWGLQGNRALGAPFIAIAAVVDTWQEKLVVHPSIHTLDDLRGKKFAVRTPGPQALLPDLWLRDQGLAQDVQQVVYPEKETGRWGHWKHVLSGACHACFMSQLYADQPLSQGLVELAFPPYPFTGSNVTLTTTEAVIQARPSDVQALVSATFDATRTFKSDPDTVLRLMREETLPLLREDFDLPDDASVERLYQLLRDELADVPLPTGQGIANALRMRLPTEPHLAAFNPLLMWDLSFARQALRELPSAAATTELQAPAL